MAVDANILINERIREEQRLGRPPLSALEHGFTRAYNTIFDCNARRSWRTSCCSSSAPAQCGDLR